MPSDALFRRAVYKAIHRPLTIAGVDRRLFFLALLLGSATFNLFYSFLAGVLMFAGPYGFAPWAKCPEAESVRILLAAARPRDRYCPAKPTPARVEVARC